MTVSMYSLRSTQIRGSVCSSSSSSSSNIREVSSAIIIAGLPESLDKHRQKQYISIHVTNISIIVIIILKVISVFVEIA